MKRLIASFFVLTLAGCGAQQPSTTQSITDGDYHGKKYYFGWGAAMAGDPSSMQNEVAYDVKHTADVFTKDIGGDYIGKQLTGHQNVNRAAIKAEWDRLTNTMLWNDMYLQYSSGHGSESGLAVGVSYDDIRDAVLAMPAQEKIILTMACHSGALVDSFNERRSEWESYGIGGRTLFVMGSSPADENSATGPGRDNDEPSGPNGSAGSAFGHAVWKAIIGYADGYNGGEKDGKVTLGEFIDYTKFRTNEVGGHTPVMAGVYDRELVLVKVPSAEVIEALEAEGGTGLSDEKIQAVMDQFKP